MARDTSFYDNSSIQINGELHHDSPDSGHREMSSDSLVQSFNVLPNDGTIWQTPPNKMYAIVSTPGSGHANYGAFVNGGNAAGFSAIDAGYQRPNSLVRTVEPCGTVTVNSSGNPFVEDLSNSNYVPNGLQSSSSSTSSERFDKENNNNNTPVTKVITPLPAQDASGNRVDLGVTPKLQPPPRVQRVSTSPSPNSGKEGVVSPDSNGNESSTLSTTSTSSSISSSEKRNSREGPILQVDSIKTGTVVTPTSTTRSPVDKDKNRSSKNTESLTEKEAEPTNANQNLKNLNMNLKSLKSPHKRHSSTSAELYGNRDPKTTMENAKIAMQSSSDSRLSHANSKTAGFDPKKPVQINVELAKS